MVKRRTNSSTLSSMIAIAAIYLLALFENANAGIEIDFPGTPLPPTTPGPTQEPTISMQPSATPTLSDQPSPVPTRTPSLAPTTSRAPTGIPVEPPSVIPLIDGLDIPDLLCLIIPIPYVICYLFSGGDDDDRAPQNYPTNTHGGKNNNNGNRRSMLQWLYDGLNDIIPPQGQAPENHVPMI